MPRKVIMRSLCSPNRASSRARIARAEASSPVRRAERNRFSWMVHDSGVSREKRRESGHGSDETGDEARMRGAFCDSARAVAGGI